MALARFSFVGPPNGADAQAVADFNARAPVHIAGKDGFAFLAQQVRKGIDDNGGTQVDSEVLEAFVFLFVVPDADTADLPWASNRLTLGCVARIEQALVDLPFRFDECVNGNTLLRKAQHAVGPSRV